MSGSMPGSRSAANVPVPPPVTCTGEAALAPDTTQAATTVTAIVKRSLLIAPPNVEGCVRAVATSTVGPEGVAVRSGIWTRLGALAPRSEPQRAGGRARTG